MASVQVIIFIPQKQIKAYAGIGLTTAKRMEAKGTFPKRRQIVGQKGVGWLYSEVRSWAEALPEAV